MAINISASLRDCKGGGAGTLRPMSLDPWRSTQSLAF